MHSIVGVEVAEYLEIDPSELELLRQHPDLLSEAIESARSRIASRGEDVDGESEEGGTDDDGRVEDAHALVEAFEAAFNRPGRLTDEEWEGDGSVADPSRRHARGRDEILTAIEEEPPTTSRTRVIPRKEWEARDPAIREYLLQTYGGRCQICDGGFERRDGQPYFEAKYVVSPTKARWLDTPANALCLCPMCLAKMLHGSIEAPDVVEQITGLVEQAAVNDDEGSVQLELCGEPAEILFARRHLIDLGALLEAASDHFGDD
jgi:hypothetical protein